MIKSTDFVSFRGKDVGVYVFFIESPVFVFSYLQYTESGGYEVKEFKLVWLVG